MEKKAFYRQLVNRYVAKSLTDEELEVFVELVKQGELDEELSLVMQEAEENFDDEEVPVVPKVHKLWPRLAIVAATLTAITLGVWLFYNSQYSGNTNEVLAYAKNNITPGQNGATLTLSNGKVIKLSNVQSGVKIGSYSVTYNDGSSVTPGADERIIGEPGVTEIRAATARGQMYTVSLQDGTKVWLNAASTLTFPSTFAKANKRIVTLEGEAYFEVFKDKSHPFIVKSKKHNLSPEQEITVLGTHFNVNAYGNESSIKTTLLEGSVKISSSTTETGAIHAEENDIVLKPNQQAVLSGPHKIIVANVDATLSVDWKNGSFVFQSQKISEIMKRVERWYNVQVVYKNNTIKDLTFTGEISRYDQVSELLKILQRTGRVSFEIENRTIIVGD